MRSSFVIVGRGLVGLVAGLTLAGCGGVEPVAPHEVVTDPAQLFMWLTLDHRAVTLSTAAPYDTLQLTATPRNARGEPLSGLPAPTFRSIDTTKVWVTPEGVLEARAAGTGIRVIAEVLADGNIRHADTALVNVTPDPTPPVLEILSIDPVPPDSAIWSIVPAEAVHGNALLLRRSGVFVMPEINLRALDADGNPITGLALRYESLDPDILQINAQTGRVTNPSRTGQGAIVVRTTAYGVTKVDTAVFTVTLPVAHGVVVQRGDDEAPPVFGPDEVMIRQHGYVFWTNLRAEPVEVTFDDPTNVAAITPVCDALGGVHCTSGDIAAFDFSGGPLNATRGRQFSVPGTYTYHISGIGSGRVVVVEE